MLRVSSHRAWKKGEEKGMLKKKPGGGRVVTRDKMKKNEYCNKPEIQNQKKQGRQEDRQTETTSRLQTGVAETGEE